MVQLVPMTESEFQEYMQSAIIEYAQEHVRSGDWNSSEALEKSKKAFQQLLPDGRFSKDQYLFSIKDDPAGLTIGMIWF